MITKSARDKILPAALKRIDVMEEQDECSCSNHQQHAWQMKQVRKALPTIDDQTFDNMIHIMFRQDSNNPDYIEYIKNTMTNG